jgi:hypothetical protein
LETKLWDVTSRAGRLTARGFMGDSFHFSPDGRFLGFSRDGGKIQVWRAAWGGELRVIGRSGNRGDWAEDPELDASGRLLAAATLERLSVFDVTSGEELASVAVPYRATRPFGFDPAGAWFTGGTRGVMLWPLRPNPARPESLLVGPPRQLASGDGTEARAAPITNANDRFKTHGVTVRPVPAGAATAGSTSAAPLQPLLSGFASYL